MFRVISLYIFKSIVLLSLCASAFANSDEFTVAQAVWVDGSDEFNQIRTSQFNGESWLDSEVLYSSKNPLTSVALSTSSNGTKLLIWTEQKRLKTVLMSMVSTKDRWSEATIFSDKSNENFSATIVRDMSNAIWVFWSAASPGLSDILMKRFVNNGWSEVERVHDHNEVPDNRPRASLNELGETKIEWQSYDLAQGQYVLESRLFPNENSNSILPFAKLIDKTLPDEVSPPSEVKANTQVLLHFPNNQMIQSQLIEN